MFIQIVLSARKLLIFRGDSLSSSHVFTQGSLSEVFSKSDHSSSQPSNTPYNAIQSYSKPSHPKPIGILTANMRYSLVGKDNHQTVPSVEPVPRVGQLHLRRVSRASVIKPTNTKAGNTRFLNTLNLLTILL